MNSIKNAALIVLLAGAGYLAWQHISAKPLGPPPPGVPQESAGVPKVDVPDMGGPSVAGTGAPRGPVDPNSEAPPFMPTKMSAAGGQLPAPGREVAPPAAASRPGPSADAAAQAKAPGGPSAVPGTAPPTDPRVGADPPAPPPADRRPDDQIGEQFVKCMNMARGLLEQDQFTDVLVQLSQWYNHPELTRAEAAKLVEVLDELAGSVIYSRQHRLEPPYRVRPGDTLPQIGQAYGVPWELLAKINGIRDPQKLEPGQELKVVRGPFHAVVRLGDREMTLMLEYRDDQGQPQPVYAGRFPVASGPDAAGLPGSYEVLRKHPGPRGAKTGPLALHLTKGVSIHGPSQSAPSEFQGGIEASTAEIEDIYDILTIGSRVVICR